MKRILSENLEFWRSERPDEWTMDEFIRDAKLLEKAIIPQPIESAPKDGTLIDIVIGIIRYPNCRYNYVFNHWEYVNIWDGSTRAFLTVDDAFWLAIPTLI